MLEKINLEHILFLDIETVPEEESFLNLPEEKQLLWEEKTRYQRKEEFTPAEFYERAGIWAEFGKIICISVGHFKIKEGKRNFRTTTFHGDEKQLLQDFSALLNTHFNKPEHVMCAHNGKEFDFPYIARRMIINEVALPPKLHLSGKKPWEVAHLDTMELWKFGDYKHFTSLKLLTNILGIPTPKDDIDGKQVRNCYYNNELPRIITYCEKDVIAIAQIVLKFRREKLLSPEEITSI
ncbi:3'-5' exonuclease [Zunongwangia sp. H14]|uniref:3'-5' exonuclease n=1 Tax=Zunongwangia sp. H14 TaxID=3240792 RepID=UPI003564AB3F